MGLALGWDGMGWGGLGWGEVGHHSSWIQWDKESFNWRGFGGMAFEARRGEVMVMVMVRDTI